MPTLVFETADGVELAREDGGMSLAALEKLYKAGGVALCPGKCCNSCGHMVGCPFILAVGTDNGICLDHAEFACGGTECTRWCHPFSTAPRHRYRFVGEITYVGVEEPKTSLPGVKLLVRNYCRID